MGKWFGKPVDIRIKTHVHREADRIFRSDVEHKGWKRKPHRALNGFISAVVNRNEIICLEVRIFERGKSASVTAEHSGKCRKNAALRFQRLTFDTNIIISCAECDAEEVHIHSQSSVYNI